MKLSALLAIGAMSASCVPGASSSSSEPGCVALDTVAQNCPRNWGSVPDEMATFCVKNAPFFEAFRSKGVCRGWLRYTRHLFDGGPRFCLYDPVTLALVGWGAFDGKANFEQFSCGIKRDDFFDDQGCEATGCVLPDAGAD
jgi:hypothetical protein